MDRGVWCATVREVTELDMTEWLAQHSKEMPSGSLILVCGHFCVCEKVYTLFNH